MNLLNLNILKVLIENDNQLITSSNLESKIEGISKRAILNELKILLENKRVKKVGRSSSTAYKMSNEYYLDFEHRLYIYQNHILIGYLGYDFEYYYFVYDTNYILSTKHSVRFQMPLGLKTYNQKSCFVDFEECLPEGIDKKILIEKTSNATEFFLLQQNDYSSNDLIFSKNEIVFKKNMKIYNYLSNKNKILGKNKFPNVLELDVDIDRKTLFPDEFLQDEEQIKKIRTMSLSGYQHKLQVILEDNTIRIPNDDENVSYFIKPYHLDKADENSDYYFPHIAINEHLHLTFAKNELNFDVPLSGIFKTKDDKEYHYIVKYFDRLNGYKFQRKEFSTYMGLNSSNKYNTSSEKLFEKSIDVFPREFDKLRMLEYYFYSFIIRHEDMHTKNISAICDDDKTFLAPLYDIASTGFYTNIQNYESHLPINEKQTNIRYNDFLELVKRAKVNRNDFKQKATFILQTYIKKMPKYIKRIATLENTNFFIKDKANAQNKKIKIRGKTTLEAVMLDAFHKRLKTLEKNGWFEKLNYESTFS